jgi:hypothetical protein
MLEGQAILEHAHDAEAHVETDEVGQLERANRMVEPDPRSRVDVLGRADPLLVGSHRLGEEWHEDAVDDEPGLVCGHDDLLAEGLRELPDGHDGRVARVARSDELDEGHDRDRAEEVHPDEPPPAGARDGFRQPMDGDRARVRGEDRRRRGDRVELAPQAVLDLEVLEHGLHDEVGGGGRLQPVGRGQPGDRRVARLGRELALVDGPGEVAGDALDAGGRPPEVRLVDRHVLADRCVDLGDAVAHQPGAGHEHPLDGHAASVGRGAARDARRTPMTTAPARATPAPTRNTAG